MIIRREIISRLASLLKQNQLTNSIDRMPLAMVPKNKESHRRCCIYKERAIIKYKTLPLLGFCPAEETDELKPLSQYAQEALEREEVPSKKIMTIVDEACTSCVKANYHVSNLCRGCVARSCQMNCPKDALDIDHRGQAHINSSKCISCGICKQACPYHAIIFVPVPCEEACPVGAIKKNENGVETINEEKCIYCGKCINSCPFGSIFEISHFIDILNRLTKKVEMTALVAPALFAQYKCEPSQLFSAIKKLGFKNIVEVAEGAITTAKNEAEELKERIENGAHFMTTSCCPSYIEVVNKHIKPLKEMVSHTPSPMQFAGLIARERHPTSPTVFIGPCVAKRKEAIESPHIDFVMTFEELDAIFNGFGINVKDEPIGEQLINIPFEARNFAVTSGVTSAVKKENSYLYIKEVIINGLDKKNIALLKAYAKGKAPGNFIEVMSCQGGCIGGPCTVTDESASRKAYKYSLDKIYDSEAEPVI